MTKKQQKIELKAQARTILGRKVKQVREAGFVPAVLYGKGYEPISLQVPKKDFDKTYKLAGESTLVYVSVDDAQAVPTIIHDVALDPMSNAVMHADFYKVRLDEKIKTSIQVTFIGESPAVVELQGIFVRNVNELEVEALPQNLPHEITIDISALKKFGDQILVKDIDLGPDVKIMAELEEIIATVQEPISEEELKAELEAPITDVSAVGEVEKEKKEEEPVEEGAVPAAEETKE